MMNWRILSTRRQLEGPPQPPQPDAATTISLDTNNNNNDNNDGADSSGSTSTVEADDDVQTKAMTTTVTGRGLTDWVELVPFDVQIALRYNSGIQVFEVSNIVTEWMNDSYERQLEEFQYTPEYNYAAFEAVVLVNRPSRRTLLSSSSSSHLRRAAQEDAAAVTFNNNNLTAATTPMLDLYTAKFKGGAYFLRQSYESEPVPESQVLIFQQMTFYNTTALLQMLQYSSVLGLGSAVVDVKAFLNPIQESNGMQDNNNGNENSGLEIVIIAAISVAVLAFLFLLGAVLWAYRYDRQNKEAYKIDANAANAADKGKSQLKQDPTDSDTGSPKTESPPKQLLFQPPPRYPAYPMEICGESVIDNPVYPESVMSDSVVSDHKSQQLDDNDDDPPEEDDYYQGAPEEEEDSQIELLDDDDEVSATLSQYYNSGMGKVGVINNSPSDAYGKKDNKSALNDNGSVSSMESYGFSLDGTLPSVAPQQQQQTLRAAAVAVAPKYGTPKKLEHIGGLPVEPDLSALEHMTMEDIGMSITSETASQTRSVTSSVVVKDAESSSVEDAYTVEESIRTVDDPQ